MLCLVNQGIASFSKSKNVQLNSILLMYFSFSFFKQLTIINCVFIFLSRQTASWLRETCADLTRRSHWSTASSSSDAYANDAREKGIRHKRHFHSISNVNASSLAVDSKITSLRMASSCLPMLSQDRLRTGRTGDLSTSALSHPMDAHAIADKQSIVASVRSIETDAYPDDRSIDCSPTRIHGRAHLRLDLCLSFARHHRANSEQIASQPTEG